MFNNKEKKYTLIVLDTYKEEMSLFYCINNEKIRTISFQREDILTNERYDKIVFCNKINQKDYQSRLINRLLECKCITNKTQIIHLEGLINFEYLLLVTQKVKIDTNNKVNIEINDIIIPKSFKESTPSIIKVQEKLNYYKINKSFDKSIIINKDKVLQDGYITYLLCKLFNIDKIDVILT